MIKNKEGLLGDIRPSVAFTRTRSMLRWFHNYVGRRNLVEG
jgi:hypothetical protein